MSLTKEELVVTDFKSGQNYAFISYCSKNEEEVFNKYVVPLQEEHGLRVYFDKNFKDHAAENWSDQMNRNITRAKICIAFVSKEYLCSYACLLEILTAIVNKIPILKIQINTLEPFMGYEEKTVSESTSKAFQKIAKMMSLKSEKYGAYYGEYLKIEDEIENGLLAVDTLSGVFMECLAQIDNTRINDKDGMIHICKSIKNAVRGGENGDPFDSDMILRSASSTASSPVAPSSHDGEVTQTEQIKTEKSATEKVSADAAKEEYKPRKSLNAEAKKEASDRMDASIDKAQRGGFAAGSEKYNIYGRESGGNQSDMMIDIIKSIIDRYPDMLDVIDNALISVECKPMSELKDITYFRVGKEFKCGRTTYSIGTSFSRDAKLAQIRKAIMAVGEDPHCFVIDGLFNDSQLEKAERIHKNFDTNGVKAEAEEIKAGNAAGDETYTIYGKQYSGNQTAMMTDAINAIIEKDLSKLDALADELTSVAADSISNLSDITYFRSGKEYRHGDVVYSIGTSFGRKDKLAQIRKAIAVAGENPKDFEIQDLYNEKQFIKAEASYLESQGKKSSMDASDEVDDVDNDDADILCCFLSKYNGSAAELLGYRSVNAAMTAFSEKWDIKVSTLRNIRDTFDPFFPESGRRGWWQKMDKISVRRKNIIDIFKDFEDVNEAFEFVSTQIDDLD